MSNIGEKQSISFGGNLTDNEQTPLTPEKLLDIDFVEPEEAEPLQAEPEQKEPESVYSAASVGQVAPELEEEKEEDFASWKSSPALLSSDQEDEDGFLIERREIEEVALD